MSNIGGEKRESKQGNQEYSKKVGIFEGSVIAVNPDAEQYKDLLGIELKEGSKATEYLGTSRDGNTTVRIDIWLEEAKSKEKLKVTFFLENKEKENKDGTKKQYINNIGSCSWAADANDLPQWFAKRDYRVAFVGEEELYTFMRAWLSINYSSASAVLELDWKAMMKGNTKGIREQINGEYASNVISLATVKTVSKEGTVASYQGVYNKAFLPAYNLRYFRTVDYTSPAIISKLKTRKIADLKPHERFVVNVLGEYGCKDYFTFREFEEYTPGANLVSSNAAIATDDASY